MLAVKVVTSGRTLNFIKKPSWQSFLQAKYKMNQCFTCYDGSDQFHQKRKFQTSHIRRDLEAAFKAIGAGIAATGVIGPGIGVGIVFGNLLSASARNPSVSPKLFQSAIMGAAFCEALGLLAVVISFLAFLF